MLPAAAAIFSWIFLFLEPVTENSNENILPSVHRSNGNYDLNSIQNNLLEQV